MKSISKEMKDRPEEGKEGEKNAKCLKKNKFLGILYKNDGENFMCIHENVIDFK